MTTDNNFFHLLAETGIIGFLGLLYWLSYFLCASLKAYHKKKNPYDLLIFTTVLSYVVLFGQVEYTLDMSANMRIFWFLLGCLLQLKVISPPSPRPIKALQT